MRRPELANIAVTLVKFNLVINFDTSILSREGREPVCSINTALQQRLSQTAPYDNTVGLIPRVQ